MFCNGVDAQFEDEGVASLSAGGVHVIWMTTQSIETMLFASISTLTMSIAGQSHPFFFSHTAGTSPTALLDGARRKAGDLYRRLRVTVKRLGVSRVS